MAAAPQAVIPAKAGICGLGELRVKPVESFEFAIGADNVFDVYPYR